MYTGHNSPSYEFFSVTTIVHMGWRMWTLYGLENQANWEPPNSPPFNS
jgi:hypothetical protein